MGVPESVHMFDPVEQSKGMTGRSASPLRGGAPAAKDKNPENGEGAHAFSENARRLMDVAYR
jgi:hypothetical protein